MVNRRPSPAIVVPEGVVKGEGRKRDLFVLDEKCILFGDTLSFSFSFFLLILQTIIKIERFDNRKREIEVVHHKFSFIRDFF